MPGDQITPTPDEGDVQRGLPLPEKVALPGTPAAEIAPIPAKPAGPEMETVYLRDLLSPARLAAVGAALKSARTKQAVSEYFKGISEPGQRVNREGKPDEDGWINEEMATKVLQGIDDLDLREMVRKRIDEDNKQQSAKFKTLALKIKAYGEKVGGNRGFVMPDLRDQSIAADVENLRVNDPESLDKLYKESNQKEREAKSQIRADERWHSQEKLRRFYADYDLDRLKSMSPEDVQHLILGSGMLGSEQRAVLGFYHALQRDAKPLETASALVRQRALEASHGNKRLADSRYGNAMQILMDEGWSAKYEPKALSDRLDKLFQDPGFLKRIIGGEKMEADRSRVPSTGPAKAAPGKQRVVISPEGKRYPLMPGFDVPEGWKLEQ